MSSTSTPTSQDLFAVLDTGIALNIPEDGTLEVFSCNPDNKSVKSIQDPAIWEISSAGQSAGVTYQKSWIRIPDFPQKGNKMSKKKKGWIAAFFEMLGDIFEAVLDGVGD
tara:strand:- start:454 stop:783 length:330 start_codon:yes stop_codon:yes gene_type:complete